MSSFGKIFKVTTFGESHGKSVGWVIDGVPSMMKLDESDIQIQMDRRRPGQNSLTTPRDEKDKVTIWCGTEKGVTLGTPILITVANEDIRPQDYSSFSSIPRPGHADYTYLIKYGVSASSGGGRSSARETIGRVWAGAVASKYLSEIFETTFVSYVSSVGEISIPSDFDPSSLSPSEVDRRGTFVVFSSKNSLYLDFEGKIRDHEGNVLLETDLVQSKVIENEEFKGFELDGEVIKDIEQIINFRCPHPQTAVKMIEKVKRVKEMGDSIGGIATGMIFNSPRALGEPWFEKFEALLAMAMLSLPATKGFEFGSGFEGTKLLGSQHNDMFEYQEEFEDNKGLKTEIKCGSESERIISLNTKTNNAGGTLGGITTGNTINFRVAVKPVSTISIEQNTVNYKGESVKLEAKGRHDPWVLPRIVPIIESMSAIVTMDLTLRQLARKTSSEALFD